MREEAVVRGRTDKGRGGGEKVGDRETNRHTYIYREKEMGRGWVFRHWFRPALTESEFNSKSHQFLIPGTLYSLFEF